MSERQERVEQTLDGLVALMNNVNHRLVAMDDELENQTVRGASSADTAAALLPPGLIAGASEHAQP